MPPDAAVDSAVGPPTAAAETQIPAYTYPTQSQVPVGQHFSFFPATTAPMAVDSTTVPPEGSDHTYSFFNNADVAPSEGSDMDISVDDSPPPPPAPPVPPPHTERPTTDASVAASQTELPPHPSMVGCQFCGAFHSRQGMANHQRTAHRMEWFAMYPDGRRPRNRGRQNPPPTPPPPTPTAPPLVRPWDWAAAQEFFPAMLLQLRPQPMWEHVPVPLRPLAGSAVGVAHARILSHPTDPGGWFLLLMFPRWCLTTTPGKPHRHQLQDNKERLRRFLAGAWPALHADYMTAARIYNDRLPELAPPNSPELREERLLARVLKLIKAGQLSKAARNLVPSEAAPQSAETRAALEALHPPLPHASLPAWVPSYQPTGELDIPTATLLRAFAGAPRLSSPGPSGWTYELLHDLFKEEEEDTVRGLPLSPLLHLLVNGRVPEAVAAALCSSHLLALAKPNSGVRPIAIGEVWMRLASRSVMLHYRDDFQELLAPLQLGVAVPGGSEAVVLGIRAALEAHPDWVLLSMDLTNAFNSVDRARVFEALQTGGPAMRSLIPFVRMQYGQEGHLWYKDSPSTVHLIRSRTGTRQGDPLSGALFALAHLSALKAIRQAHPTCHIPTVADDSYLLGPPEAVRDAYATFVSEMGSLQLQVKPSKCILYAPGGLEDDFLPGITMTKEGVKVLGAPIGSLSYQASFFQRVADHKTLGLPLLVKLEDAQAAHALLQQSFLTRMHYLLRCTPLSEQTAAVTDSFHQSLLECMESLLEYRPGSMPEQARLQLQLPISKGGLGLVPPALVAPAAILGSWALSAARIPTLFPGDTQVLTYVQTAGDGSLPLQTYLQRQWSIYHELLPNLPPLSDMQAAPITKFQATCSSRRVDVLAGAFLAQLPSAAHQARFRSVFGPQAGAWLHSGGGVEDLALPHDVFITAARLRLGLPLRGIYRTTVCPCGAPVDRIGHHLLHCPTGGALIPAHNALRDCLASIFRRAGYGVEIEVLGQLLETANVDLEQRTDLVLHKGGQKILCDVTIRSPTCPSRIRRAAQASRVAAQEGEAVKERDYRHRPAGVRFVPAAFESFGVWGTKIKAFLASLWPHIERGHATSPKIRLIRTHLQRVIATALTRGVALHLLHKLQRLPPPPLAPSTPSPVRVQPLSELLHDLPFTGQTYYF